MDVFFYFSNNGNDADGNDEDVPVPARALCEHLWKISSNVLQVLREEGYLQVKGMWNHHDGHNMNDLASIPIPFSLINLFVDRFDEFGTCFELDRDVGEFLIRQNCQLIIQKYA
jgi:hypothetical protein